MFSARGVALNVTTASVQLRVLYNSAYLSARLKLRGTNSSYSDFQFSRSPCRTLSLLVFPPFWPLQYWHWDWCAEQIVVAVTLLYCVRKFAIRICRDTSYTDFQLFLSPCRIVPALCHWRPSRCFPVYYSVIIPPLMLTVSKHKPRNENARFLLGTRVQVTRPFGWSIVKLSATNLNLPPSFSSLRDSLVRGEAL
jgi:hypothetical protein